MAEAPNGREMYDLITEIKVELGVINTKVDYFSDVKQKAEEAKSTADTALRVAEENREDIRDMKANSKWIWGTLISVAAIIVSVSIAVFT